MDKINKLSLDLHGVINDLPPENLEEVGSGLSTFTSDDSKANKNASNISFLDAFDFLHSSHALLHSSQVVLTAIGLCYHFLDVLAVTQSVCRTDSVHVLGSRVVQLEVLSTDTAVELLVATLLAS